MNCFPHDIAFRIIGFLPVVTQLNVCKTTRTRSLPKAQNAHKTITKNMQKHKARILSLARSRRLSAHAFRLILPLYISKAMTKRLLIHIMNRGFPGYIQDAQVMAADPLYGIKFPDHALDTAIAGFMLDWSPKKILRLAIRNLDITNLLSLELAMHSRL